MWQVLKKTGGVPPFAAFGSDYVLLTFTLGPRHMRAAVFFQMLDDDPGHILAGGGLNAFQAWR